MSADTVIKVEGLSKSYLIGHQAAPAHETFREMLTRSLRSAGRGVLQMARGGQMVSGDEIEEFWALQDLSFEIRRGEVVGVVGRNGAGKSTLLKVLSRITDPTRGRVTINGRVASLLEVGTGFHPELTGRENVYLNGAILGMSRQEIKAQFDEIVAFAEVEKFLDTPVKRYSSGMYVRLAFAVAAHLEPEILIVDEVLAVGDAEFQKKCLGKMDSIAQHGRTVLFVSHNLSTLRALCNRGILLNRGRIAEVGTINQVLSTYSVEGLTNARTYDEDSVVSAVAVEQEGGDIVLILDYRNIRGRLAFPAIGFILHDIDGRAISGHNILQDADNGRIEWPDTGRITATISQPRLLDGSYLVSIYFGDSYQTIFTDLHCLTLTVSGMAQAAYELEVERVGPVYPQVSYAFN